MSDEEDATVPEKGDEPTQGRKDRSDRIPDSRGMERILGAIGRLLGDREFESEEEMNAFLQGALVGGRVPDREPETPLERAQELVYQAFDAKGRERVRLAREALEVSEDCADAYVLLAEETARSPEEARELYERGMEAGERALGSRAFEEDVGHFWGIIETRPYMRAREGLAASLRALGRWEEAVDHYRDLLRLNPGDNQGIRYDLLHALMEGGEGEDDAIEELFGRYPDDALAEWLYGRALWLFRREGGGSSAALEALEEAVETNPHVPPYLLGWKTVPRRVPEYHGFGDDSEAVAYAARWYPLWKETEGARRWLADFMKEWRERGG